MPLIAHHSSLQCHKIHSAHSAQLTNELQLIRKRYFHFNDKDATAKAIIHYNTHTHIQCSFYEHISYEQFTDKHMNRRTNRLCRDQKSPLYEYVQLCTQNIVLILLLNITNTIRFVCLRDCTTVTFRLRKINDVCLATIFSYKRTFKNCHGANIVFSNYKIRNAYCSNMCALITTMEKMRMLKSIQLNAVTKQHPMTHGQGTENMEIEQSASNNQVQ